MGDCKAIDGKVYLNTNVGDRLHMQAKPSELAKFLRKPNAKEESKQPSAVRMSSKRLREFILK